MRVVFLNTWCGIRQADLLAWLVRMDMSTDIFMLSEVNHWQSGMNRAHEIITADASASPAVSDLLMINQRDVIESMLPQRLSMFTGRTYDTITCARSKETYTDVGYGLHMLWTESEKARVMRAPRIHFIASGHEVIFGSGTNRQQDGISPVPIQWMILSYAGQRYLIAHLHGLWKKGKTKCDLPERYVQSLNLLTALETIAQQHTVDHIIFGGDLNLDIDTRALGMLEQGTLDGRFSFRNLVKEHNISNTRTKFYRHYDDTDASLYADYVFASQDVEVQHFEVPYAPISDHRPMILDFG